MDYILKSSNISDVTLRGVLSYIAEQPKVCVKVLNRRGEVVAVSSRGLRLLNAEINTMVGKVWTDFWSGAHHGEAIEICEAAFDGHHSQFTGTHHGLAEPGEWRVEAMPLERQGQKVETILVISTHLPDPDSRIDFAAQEAKFLELLHKMANISSAALAAGRLLQGDMPKETVQVIAQSLIEVGTQATESLNECREGLKVQALKPREVH